MTIFHDTENALNSGFEHQPAKPRTNHHYFADLEAPPTSINSGRSKSDHRPPLMASEVPQMEKHVWLTHEPITDELGVFYNLHPWQLPKLIPKVSSIEHSPRSGGYLLPLAPTVPKNKKTRSETLETPLTCELFWHLPWLYTDFNHDGGKGRSRKPIPCYLTPEVATPPSKML